MARPAPEALGRLASEVLAAVTVAAEGTAPVVPEPPAGLAAAEARLSRSLARIGAWAARHRTMMERLALKDDELAAGLWLLAVEGASALKDGVSQLAHPAACAESAARTKAVANTLEDRRRRGLEEALKAPPLEGMRRKSALDSFSEGADLLEKAAVDLALRSEDAG